jgi:hypothetical protein
MTAKRGARFILNGTTYRITQVTSVNIRYSSADAPADEASHFRTTRKAFASFVDAGLITVA